MKRPPIITSLFYLVPMLLVWGLSHNAYAQSPISCHCFKDRDYQPADRFAADDYILATSFNSLLAKSFAISKRQIIMLKMNQGVPQNDLLIGLEASRVSGDDINKLLNLRRADKTWQEIMTGMSQQEKLKSDPLLAGIIAGMPADLAGSSIADKIITQFFNVPMVEIHKLRNEGVSEKEMALLFILAHAKNRKPETLLEQRRGQNKSWSEIAHDSSVTPAAAGKLILAYPAKQIAE